jgi:arachidonate 5-lipoxygenase
MSNQRVEAHDRRGRNYLKYEYEDRVNTKGAKYRLQIQLRDAEEGESHEIFNNMIIWNEGDYPWMDLATFKIDEIFDWEEGTRTAFSVNHMPKSLGVLPAASIFDYNSINYMRKHSEIARKARNLSYKLYGMVPPVPDNDNRNVSGFGE